MSPKTPPARQTELESGMSLQRRSLVSVGLLLLIGIHAYENLIDHEHWPFCSYPMYSWLERERSVSAHRLAGILADGEETPIQANEYTYPLDQARFSDALWRIEREPDAKAREQSLLEDMLQRYERRRRAGDHSGPAIVGLRLYRTKHELRPWAENLVRPEHRDLLAEVRSRP
jgi:hypothetical protein